MSTIPQEVNLQVQRLLSLLPHEYQRDLASLAVARIYFRIQDYPMAIKYLYRYLKAKNEAVVHKLIGHIYRMLKSPCLDKAMTHYKNSIHLNPRQPHLVLELSELLLAENSIISADSAIHWLKLAKSEIFTDDELVSSLHAIEELKITESKGKGNDEDKGEEVGKDDGDDDGDDDGAHDGEGDDGDDDGGGNDGDDDGEDNAKIEGDDDGDDNRKAEKLEKQPDVLIGSDEENEEVKFYNWAKARGLGLSRIRRDNTTTIPGVSMLNNENLAAGAHDQIVAGMINQDTEKKQFLLKAPEISRAQWEERKFHRMAVANSIIERRVEAVLQSAKANMNLAALPAGHDAFRLPISTRAIAQSYFKKENEKYSTLSATMFIGASFMPIPLTLAAKLQGNSLQSKKQKQLIKIGYKPSGHSQRKLAVPRLPKGVRRENKQQSELLQKKSEKERDTKPGLNQGDALNLPLGAAPAAPPATGVFSFGALNTATSAGQNVKTNSSGAFRGSPFIFSPLAVAASLGSRGVLNSSKLKAARQRARALLHNKKELLYIHRAKLYRLIDGDWKKCGLGDVKIYRHIETKELRVIMRKKFLCLDHPLNTNVVYKPMDSKSWIFAAYDCSGGESILGRFILRFKEQNASQDFYSAVKSALNGTAKAI